MSAVHEALASAKEPEPVLRNTPRAVRGLSVMTAIGIPRRGERERDAPIMRGLIVLLVVSAAVLSPFVLAAMVFVVLPARASRHAHAEERMRRDAHRIRTAVLLYLGTEPGKSCASVRALEQSGSLDVGQNTNDAWNHPFHIDCVGYDIIVRSDGPDGVPGTADDIER